jgi:putative pyruvate formate lyase activating enzyme
VLQECRANIPQIWNSNMYLTTSSMELLDGVIDLFLTDFKYGNDACARRLSKVPDYFRIVSRNHLLASEQAEVIIRHLVLPNHVDCCSIPILEWIAENTPQAQVNVMAQYRPMHLASHYPEIRLSLAPEEYNRTYRRAKELGLNLMG